MVWKREDKLLFYDARYRKKQMTIVQGYTGLTQVLNRNGMK